MFNNQLFACSSDINGWLIFFFTHFKKVADSHCKFFDSYLKVFDFQIVRGFSFLFLLLIANLIPLWSDNILCII